MKGFAWSKTPLKLLLILIVAGAVNFGLIFGIQLITSYRLEGPVDEALLAGVDSRWENCEIQDHKEIHHSNLHVYLVRLSDGSAEFVTLRKHYLIDRYRLMEKACQKAPVSGEAIWLKAGVSQFEVQVSDKTFNGLMRLESHASTFVQDAGQQFRNQMILSIAGLCILELAVWCLVFRKEEIA